MAGRLWAGRGSRGAGRSWPMRAACSLAASPLLAFTSWSLRCLHRSMSGVYRRIAGEDGVARLGDFGLAEVAAELEAELADARSVLAGGKPSGGFHKRHMVRHVLRDLQLILAQRGSIVAATISAMWRGNLMGRLIACSHERSATFLLHSLQWHTAYVCGWISSYLNQMASDDGLAHLCLDDTVIKCDRW